MTPSAAWRVSRVEVLAEYRIRVFFLDGTEGEVDMSALIMGGSAGVFAKLRDPSEFGKAHVDLGAVAWPGDVDLAPDAMYRGIKATGRWVP